MSSFTEPLGQQSLCQHLFQRMEPHSATPPSSENSSELSQPLHVFLGTTALLDESALAG